MGIVTRLRFTTYSTILLIGLAFGFLLFVIVAWATLSGGPAFGGFCLTWLLVFVVIGAIIQWAVGPSVVRMGLGRKSTERVTAESHPYLYGMIADLANSARVKVPEILILDDRTLNAFVFGRTASSSTLVLHSALMERCSREELRAILGHEIGHIKHRDAAVMTFLSVIPILAYMIARFGLYSLWFGGMGRRRGNAGAIMLAMMLIGLVGFAVYGVTTVLLLRLSRTRELAADAHSARVTGSPRDLISALTRITYDLSYVPKEDRGAAGLRSFYIGDAVKAASDKADLAKRFHAIDKNQDGVIDDEELQAAIKAEEGFWSGMDGMFRTHPHTLRRVVNLMRVEREMARAAGREPDLTPPKLPEEPKDKRQRRADPKRIRDW